MSSPTVQTAIIRNIYDIVLEGSSEWHHLHKARSIYAEIYVHRRRKIYLGHYFPDEITFETKDFIGMTIAEATKIIRTQKDKFNTLNNLIGGDR